MKIEINNLPELLADLIKKSGKTRQEIQKDTNLSNSTLTRLCSRTHGMQKHTAKVLNDYFEVPYFINYQIKNGVCVHSNIIKLNKQANKFNPGDNVLNLFNKNIFIITDIVFNKSKQEWMYKYHNEWIEEFYLKEINLEEPKITLESIASAEMEFEIPQIEVTPEESINQTIEKIDDKDSIKSILKDVVTRLIELV